MSDLKIKIDQLKLYLGTNLDLYMDYDDEYYIDVLTGLIDDSYFTKEGEGDDYLIKNINPIMYRLSDLDKHITELGFVPIKELIKMATKQIWGEPIEWFIEPDILTDDESTGIIAYNDTERISFTCDKTENRFDFSLYVDGSEMMLNKWVLFQKLLEWNFWIFDQEYFEKGLIIDKLTIN